MTRPDDPADRLLDAALTHVPFDGWSDATLTAAARDAEVSTDLARALYPRGAVDLALAYHRRGDGIMRDRMQAADLSNLRYRDRVAQAVRWRIEAAGDRELVRRGMALFTLPQHAGDGSRALWGTADAIWEALGDTSRDVNWYTKRATLSGVYGSTVLFWLGDDSPENADTWAFLDRRIDDVMGIEKFKAKLRESKLASALLAGPMAVLGQVRAPRRGDDLPGRTG